MPEPLLYLKGMGAAAVVSAMIVLAIAALGRPASVTRLNLACILAMGLGLAAGGFVMSLRVAWPPLNALDRLLVLILPATLGLELIAGMPRVPPGFARLLRLSLAVAIPRILLHGSGYLSGSVEGWSPGQVRLALAASGGVLAGVWELLAWLSRRSPGVSIPLALGLAIQCAGLTVMLAGYLKGGAAAFPLAATVVATVIGASLSTRRSSVLASVNTPAILGIGVIGLFGVLFIGRFFGRLSTGSALVMLLAPLLCWVTEIPVLRRRSPWFVGCFRLALVAIPLVVVLAIAKRTFDREMGPLL